MTRWFLCLFVSLGLSLFAAANARAEAEDGEEGGEAGEVHVNLSDCPEAVQATIREETRGGKIREIEREREKGKVVYEAEFVSKGKVYEITVSEDGKLLGKEREDEEAEDGDNNNNNNGDDAEAK
jgi:uncharacterized membrane protein YkoI